MKDRNRSALKRLKTLTFIITFALLFALPALPAQAAKWELAASDEGRSAFYYVDTETIQATGKTIRYWRKQNIAEPNSYGIASNVTLIEFDPSRREYKILYVVGYSASGDYVAGGAVSNISGPIIPGTVGEVEAKHVCKLTGVKLGR